jgi:tuberculosinol/isotuberculosinol synthase
MNHETFLELPTEEVAQLVHEMGPKVCVFPINGTRRWFVLEHRDQAASGVAEDYLRIGGQRHVELYRMFFDHGIDTLLTPSFGPDVLERGSAYRSLLDQGLVWFATNEDFLNFYHDYDVRVRVYGDVERHLVGTPYQHALDAYEQLARRTASHQTHRLFFGICAHDPVETIAEISVRFHEENARLPTKREIVEAYYGEHVEPVDLFIGFADRPAVFDMPLIATGSEDIYFTVSPSPYLDDQTLRAILYDHLYARRIDDTGYANLSAADWRAMDDFYALNRRHVLGLGRKDSSERFWHPLPQVTLPQRLEGHPTP